MECYGFEDGVSDIDVVYSRCSLAAGAEDGFYDDVSAQFAEGFERFIHAFSGQCTWTGTPTSSEAPKCHTCRRNAQLLLAGSPCKSLGGQACRACPFEKQAPQASRVRWGG